MGIEQGIIVAILILISGVTLMVCVAGGVQIMLWADDKFDWFNDDWALAFVFLYTTIFVAVVAGVATALA